MSDTPTPDVLLADAARGALESIERTTAAVVRHTTGSDADVVLAAMRALGPDSKVQVSELTGRVTCYVTLKGLDGFKDPRLTTVLEQFADWPATTADYTYGDPNRDFSFTHPDDHKDWLMVQVYAYVRGDSPTCRVVTVGQETVTSERRVIVCD